MMVVVALFKRSRLLHREIASHRLTAWTDHRIDNRSALAVGKIAGDQQITIKDIPTDWNPIFLPLEVGWSPASWQLTGVITDAPSRDAARILVI